jgi:simple sugar transport system permease protein
MPLVAVLLAFVVGGVILWLQGVNPFVAYREMIVGAFGSKNGLADTLVKATPLLLVGLGIAIAFRGGMINIGAEGQLIVGALLATFIGLQLGGKMPAFLVVIIGLVAGSLMGGLWAAIAGVLKAYLSVNEILSTIMLNAIAVQISYFLLRGPMIDPAELEAGTNIPHSARLEKVLDMPRFTDVAKQLGLTATADDLGLSGFLSEVYGVLVEPTRLHTGFLFAVLMAILVYIFLWRTTIGYRIRAVGLNPHASKYAGIDVKRNLILSITLSGMLAGLAGSVEIFGLHHRMFEPTAVSAGYGFTGIVAALLGNLHPIGIIPSSILFGGLLVGGDKMQRAMQVPQVLIQVILGLVVLFVVSTDYFARKYEKRRATAEIDIDDSMDDGGGTPADIAPSTPSQEALS